MIQEYKNLAHNCGVQGGDRGVHHVGAGADLETVMDPARAKVGQGLNDDDKEDEPAETAVCAFEANNLQNAGNRGSWKPLEQGKKKREKREPPQVGDPPLPFGTSSELSP